MSYKNFETLKSMIDSGMTTKEIADKYSVDRKSIEYWYKKHNLKGNKASRPKQTDVISVDEIISLLNEGLLIGDICDLYGLQRNSISRLLKAHGYNMRNHKGQRLKQSKMMTTELNPTKGTQRPKEVIVKMMEGRRKKSIEKWSNISTYKEYTSVARSIAYCVFKEGAEVPVGYEIDHIFSLKDCFENNIPVHRASHRNNLQFLTPEENKKKGCNSDITLQQFLGLTK